MITTLITAIAITSHTYVDKLPTSVSVPKFDLFVRVKDVRQIDKLEGVGSQGEPDWGGRLWIDADNKWLPVRTGNGFTPEGWFLTNRNIDKSIVKIRLSVYEDDPIRDDPVDVNPLAGKTEATFFFESTTKALYLQEPAGWKRISYDPNMGGVFIWVDGGGDKNRAKALFILEKKPATPY